MGIISGCKSVLHSLGTVNQKANWLRQGKLSRREVLKYALSNDRELRRTIWGALNREPSLIVRTVGRGGFSADIERLLRRPDAEPGTIARVFAGLILEPFNKDDLDRAVRIIKFHRMSVQGAALGEVAGLNRALFKNLRRLL